MKVSELYLVYSEVQANMVNVKKKKKPQLFGIPICTQFKYQFTKEVCHTLESQLHIHYIHQPESTGTVE